MECRQCKTLNSIISKFSHACGEILDRKREDDLSYMIIEKTKRSIDELSKERDDA